YRSGLVFKANNYDKIFYIRFASLFIVIGSYSLERLCRWYVAMATNYPARKKTDPQAAVSNSQSSSKMVPSQSRA
ncbi:MAG: hypothetical protein MHPSP_000832, partial [Paramarteilia canceri]